MEGDSKSEIPDPLKLAAEHYFGSVRKALAALNKDRRLSRGWSKPKIIATLSRMHRSRKPLTYTAARRNIPALASAAEAYFGSWGKALHAAGIDPEMCGGHRKNRRGDPDQKQLVGGP
jgi:hypothetical protein